MSDLESDQPKKWTKQKRTLSDSFCSRVQPTEKTEKYWDDRCPGLHLVVTAKGIKSLVFVATAHGRQAWITLGRFAALERPGQRTLTVAKARTSAEELRLMALEGKDVRAKVQGDREPRELSALVELFRRDYLPRLKPSTRTSTESLLKNHVLPQLGNRLVPDLVYEDVDKLHAALVQRDMATTANRVRSLLSRLFNIAAKLGWTQRGFNPSGMVERIPEIPRDRILAPSELAKLHATLQEFRVERSMDPAILEAVYFCAFSGLRRMEVLRLEWSDIDKAENTITIRDHKRSKTVGSLVLPLNSHLLDVVNRRDADEISKQLLAKKEGEGYERPKFIFASARTGSVQGGFSCSWRRVMETSDLSGATPHDLRRTFATTCTEIGNPPALADLLLGHSLGRIRDTYISMGPGGVLFKASQETSDKVNSYMNGEA